MPKPYNDKNPFIQMIQYRNSDFEIMGCILSSILTYKFEDMEPIIGIADSDTYFKYYKKLKYLGCIKATLSCRDRILNM